MDSIELFEVGYALRMEYYGVDKDTQDYREKYESRFRDMIREDESGIPMAVAAFPGADASQFGGGDK